eukprot:scaffold11036_cov120-Isochrysis_galbana.AAC.6
MRRFRALIYCGTDLRRAAQQLHAARGICGLVPRSCYNAWAGSPRRSQPQDPVVTALDEFRKFNDNPLHLCRRVPCRKARLR